VAVYTGILPITQDDAGLATVLSHEIAHAIARHGGERMTTGMLAQLGQAALNIGLSGKDPETVRRFNNAYGLGAQFGVLLPFSRNQESEADQIGLTLMARAGYDPKVAITFWQRMSKVGQKDVPEFAATHPSDETRIRKIREWLPAAEKEYRKR
jgi:predicted Zn-dependent protease